MVKRYLSFIVVSLVCLSSFSNNPRTSIKKSKSPVVKVQSLIEVVSETGGSFTLRSSTATNAPISFIIADSRGVVVMFGDNYRNGSVLNLGHFQDGSYTMYFDNDTNSAAAYFTVSK